MDSTIGIDIGGTHLRAARVDPQGRVLARATLPTERAAEACLAQCIGLVARLRDPGTRGIGIGVPGQVDVGAGRVLSGGYVDLSVLPFADSVAAAAGLPVTLDNDAGMALRGEVACGAARGLTSAVLLTIGTGIGGAILDGGRILRGTGTAGQLGHLVVVPDGRACVCGRRGCVETESAGTAFARHLAAAGLPDDLRAEAVLALDDPRAARVLRAWAAPLRAAIDTLVAALAPQVVLIGGGAGPAALAALARLPSAASWFDAALRGPALGDDAGVVGAALAARPRGRRAVLVNGVPASGKSTVAAGLAAASGWPVLALDDIKTPFLHELAPVDRDMNRRLGRAAYQAIFAAVAAMPPEATVILDAWFGFQPAEVLRAGLAAAGVAQTVEVWCHAPPDAVAARYGARVPLRPAGHPGLDYLPDLVALAARAAPTGLGPVVRADTTRPVAAARLLAEVTALWPVG